ncbi:MAG: carbohydrate kinase family protein [Acidobacteria bacterium]|nr:carbohydrate kinase family protein [Acidobacteriota bacterium]
MKPLDAIVAGELYVDLILSGFEFWPQPGQEAFAKKFHREVGGGASNTACGMAKLGSAVSVLGVVGEDGDWLVQQLTRKGADTSHISRDPAETTAFTVAISTPEERSFLTYPGANRGFPAALAEAAAARRLARAAHVHLAFPPDLSTAAELLTSIRANGCTVSLDVGWHESWLRDERLRDILPLLDLFFPNDSEAHCITGEADPEAMLRWFATTDVPRVALKLGSRGAALLWDGEIHFDIPPAVKPIDTTGAGDAFNAGFLHAWLRGNSPGKCLRSANICGALSTEAYGGVAGVPDAWRLQQLLEAHS